MHGEDRLGPAGERISTLLDALGAGGPVARERAEELVRQVTDLYGAGLQRILDILDGSGAAGSGIRQALVADDLVSGLLLIHGLHPQDVETRVAAALDSVRPYLGSHGGNVELLDISAEGVVRLRLLGTCHGCPSSPVTLRLAVQDAIEAAAPEVTGIEVVEEDVPAAQAVIPVEALLVRVNQQTGGPEGRPPGQAGGGVPAQAGAVWEPVPEFAGLESGEAAGFLIGSYPLLACRIGPDVYAYRDYCPRCTHSLAGATLQRALAAPAGGGLLRCPTCRSHFDVRQAGVCLEDRNMHLDPLPLLVRGGVMSVAVPAAAGSRG
ncbi:NifU family protein [Arthrobacter sp. I2-34]|uniref:NifU family protein n=1 Tax=Arthrobacter hankyongi TaxID=2904801 RepID=A0ABS9L884_9MICC|nr:NifU family protein [Arthrobacter hankyongi]MCG2622884.1 NifU family protein [Arthrobacter hankyongi]